MNCEWNSTEIRTPLTGMQVPGRRTAQASDSRSAVMQRSLAIRKIQEDMTALNELFNEVASLVEQQEYPVQKINEDTEKTVEDYKNANSHLSRGIISAQNARKYKWWILFICCEFQTSLHRKHVLTPVQYLLSPSSSWSVCSGVSLGIIVR